MSIFPSLSSAADGDLPPFTRAVVFDGRTETRYLRAGRGYPVIVLAGGARRTADTLLTGLWRLARVIVPEVPLFGAGEPDGTTDFSRWFSGFLDGLGVTRAAVVADELFEEAATRFALLEPERVERLLVVRDDAAAGAVALLTAAMGEGRR
jgi:pimeloyl-ACP methyl ester carboxylesterase